MNKVKVKKMVETAIVTIAKKTAKLEANSTCVFLTYQPKEPFEVKKLRQF